MVANTEGRAPRHGFFQGSVLRPYLPVLVTFVVLFGAFLFADRQNALLFSQSQRANVQHEAGLIRSRLQGVLTADIQLMRGMVGVLSTEPEMNQERFAELAAHLIDDQSEITHIAAAPDLVISLIYPLEGNEAALGLDYNDNETQRAAALRVRDSAIMRLAGPLDLVQGGRAFIARFPIFTGQEGERRFWGILSAVIDEQGLYAKTGLMDPELGIEVALVGKDSEGAGGALFYGAPEILSDRPIRADINLPSGQWQLLARPLGGWDVAPPNRWTLRALMLLGVLLILVPIFLASRMSAARRHAIKKLKRRENELETLSRRLEIAVETSKIGIWELNLGTGELIWDRRMYELYGLEEAEGAITIADWEARLNPEDREAAIEHFWESTQDGDSYLSEFRIILDNGENKYIRALGCAYSDTLGRRRIIGVDWDVSWDVHLREELIRANRALTQRNSELLDAKLAAEQADRVKTEFLANMSHEIRTPMNGILGMAELLAEANLPKDEKLFVETIRDSSNSLLKIINDILDLSRLEAGKLEIVPDDFDLHSCIEKAVNLLRPKAEAKGLLLEMEIDKTVPVRLRGDDGRLRQILVNLLGNAVKFTANGKVALRASCAKEDPYRVIIEVEDSGIGVTKSQAQHIFDRFSQADAATTRAFGGTGLGLTISSILARRMGGDIALCPRRDGELGACFRLEVQFEPEQQQLPEEGETDEAPPQVDLSVLRGARLVLAEDNRTNRLLIRKYLAGQNVQCREAVNGVDAVELCREEMPDVVLMDMSMPELDGLAATREIRALEGAQPLIIALTANAFDSHRRACLEAGMDHFLQKPIRKTLLLETLATLLAARRSSPDEDTARAG